jgi:hypothetical protein
MIPIYLKNEASSMFTKSESNTLELGVDHSGLSYTLLTSATELCKSLMKNLCVKESKPFPTT